MASASGFSAIDTGLSLDSLLLLLPHELVAMTSVIAMLVIAIGRNHFRSALVTVSGLALASLCAGLQLAEALELGMSSQLTPLFLVDSFSVTAVLLICLSSLALALMGYAYLFELDEAKDEYQLMLLLATLGALTLASAAHFATVLIGLEMLSMALYGMIAYTLHGSTQGASNLEAAVKYLVLSAVASATLLFGAALIFAETGTLTIAALDAGSDSLLFQIGLIMVLIGLGFKLSLVPLHLWTPDVYQGAPLPAAATLATIGKAAVAAFLMRLASGATLMEIDAVWGLLALVAVASIVAGNLLALRQPNLKRLLAYSSIAHMGYFLVAILASEGGADLDVALLYLLVYCVLSLGAFACVTLASSSERESSDFSDFSGLFWRSPWLAFALSVLFLGLAGIPLTAGFIAKFQLFFQAATASEWGLLAAVIVGSAIGLYYYLRLIFQMLMLPDSAEPEPGPDARVGLRDLGVESLASLVVLGILTLIVLWSGVYPEPLLSFVEAVAQAL